MMLHDSQATLSRIPYKKCHQLVIKLLFTLLKENTFKIEQHMRFFNYYLILEQALENLHLWIWSLELN